jgi:hypothetical protein
MAVSPLDTRYRLARVKDLRCACMSTRLYVENLRSIPTVYCITCEMSLTVKQRRVLQRRTCTGKGNQKHVQTGPDDNGQFHHRCPK